MNNMWLQLLQTTTLCCVLWGLVRWVRRAAVTSNSLKNLPGPPSTSFVNGNFKELFNAEAWRFHRDVSENYGSAARVQGPWGSDQLYVYDPKAMHSILNKDQHSFDFHQHTMESANVLFGKGLFATKGDHHRRQRKMLTPVFSAAHLRDMTPIFLSVTQRLLSTLLSQVGNQPREIEMKHWLSRMALELIGQSGLGHSFDPLTEGATLHPYAIASENFAPTLAKLQFPINAIYPLVSWIGTPKFQRFVVSVLPWKTLHDARDIVDTFYDTSVRIFDAKKKALEEGEGEALSKEAGRGKDIISVLMTQNAKALSEGQLTDEEVIGQMSTLVSAATDTTSSGLSQILYQLSLNPGAQERLRTEILEAQERVGEELDYDTLSSLPYLDAVCRETLRLYAPVPTSMRVAQQDTVIPLSTPVQGLDGTLISDLAIPKGTTVYLAIMASNRNKNLWGERALEWDPDRWLAPLPSALSEAKIPGVYANLMTFLGGGRSCIGFKFSQLEMKAALTLLLSKLRFSLPKDKEIVWNYTVLATPSVRGDKSRSQQLPMLVSKV